jgi:hypothetical protein
MVAPQSIPAETAFLASIAVSIAAGYASVGRRLQMQTLKFKINVAH